MCSPQSGVDGGHPVAAIHQHADEVINAFLVDLIHVLDFRQGVQEETDIAFVVEDGVGGVKDFLVCPTYAPSFCHQTDQLLVNVNARSTIGTPG